MQKKRIFDSYELHLVLPDCREHSFFASVWLELLLTKF